MAEDQGFLGWLADFSTNVSPIDFVLIASHYDLFLQGAWNTLVLVFLALFLGGIISIPLAVARANQTPVANQIIWAYVYVFRGTPLLVRPT